MFAKLSNISENADSECLEQKKKKFSIDYKFLPNQNRTSAASSRSINSVDITSVLTIGSFP